MTDIIMNIVKNVYYQKKNCKNVLLKKIIKRFYLVNNYKEVFFLSIIIKR